MLCAPWGWAVSLGLREDCCVPQSRRGRPGPRASGVTSLVATLSSHGHTEMGRQGGPKEGLDRVALGRGSTEWHTGGGDRVAPRREDSI